MGMALHHHSLSRQQASFGRGGTKRLSSTSIQSHEALLKARLASPERVAQREKLRRARLLHQILQGLDFLTSPDILDKQALRNGKVLRRRAVARQVNGVYREWVQSAPNAQDLWTQARGLYGQGMSQEQVSERLKSDIKGDWRDLDTESYVGGIQAIADNAVTQTMNRLKIERSPETDHRVTRALEGLAILLGMHFLDAEDTLAGKFAYSASDFAAPWHLESEDSLVTQLRADMVWNRQLGQRRTTETEASNAENIPAHELLETEFEERRLITMDDDRVCEICLGDAAQGWIPVDEDYESGHLNPPIHINCRCYEEGRTRRE